MKRQLIIPAFLCMLYLACTKDNSTEPVTLPPASGNTAGNGNPGLYTNLARYSGSDYSQAIPIDTANRMIQSYLNSIGYPTNSTELRSLSFDADTLRAYLNDSRIVTLKFMLAHRQSYMNAGHFGTDADTKVNALTFVIVGMDQNDEYIYNGRNMVYDHALPCPTYCAGPSPATITQ